MIWIDELGSMVDGRWAFNERSQQIKLDGWKLDGWKRERDIYIDIDR